MLSENRAYAIGLYFSPDDYHVMYKQGLPPSRVSPESESPKNSQLWQINQDQLRELLTNYGKIDILFIDEKSEWANPLVANYAWALAPDLMVTRAGLETPEQNLPDNGMASPWEACFTMGWHWQYVAGEYYKDATELIGLIDRNPCQGRQFVIKCRAGRPRRNPRPDRKPGLGKLRFGRWPTTKRSKT